MDAAFRTEMTEGYRLEEPSITLGSPLLRDEVLTEVRVQLALTRVNRHGLIADAMATQADGRAERDAGLFAARAMETRTVAPPDNPGGQGVRRAGVYRGDACAGDHAACDPEHQRSPQCY